MGNSDIIGIAEDTLQLIVDACKHTHPNEFFAYLRAVPSSDLNYPEDGRIITEILLMPATSSTPFSAEVPEYSIPLNSRGTGSVHSHPNGVLRPSNTDLQHFEYGSIHMIVGAPYTMDSWKAFDADGNHLDLSVLDVEIPEEDEEW